MTKRPWAWVPLCSSLIILSERSRMPVPFMVFHNAVQAAELNAAFKSMNAVNSYGWNHDIFLGVNAEWEFHPKLICFLWIGTVVAYASDVVMSWVKPEEHAQIPFLEWNEELWTCNCCSQPLPLYSYTVRWWFLLTSSMELCQLHS